MKTIKLKSLSLVNFKGIRALDLNFSDQVTVIYGGNGTGKTTVFDAFLWLLFGKDSTGRSDSNFNIKTLDPATGTPILRLEHSVSAVLSVDGNDIKLQRVYLEKWVKPRGTTEETLKNHETEFYVNDVKLGTKREFENEVSNIVSEDLFRMITNPFYFNSLKPEQQKQILLDMAGAVNDDEVAATKPEYIELLSQLSGRSLAQFAKEVNSKKKGYKDALAVIPSQIETAQKLMPEAEDWDALDAELKQKQQILKNYDDQLADLSKVSEAETQRKVNIQKQIGEKRIALTKRENSIRTEACSGKNEAQLKVKDLEYAMRNLTGDLQRTNASIKSTEAQISAVDVELDTLRGEYRAITAEQLQIPEGAFICPTCKRPLEVEDVERKRDEMLANFNQTKAGKLRNNKERGMAKKQTRDNLAANRENLLAKAAELQQGITTKQGEIEALRAQIPADPNVSELISADQECIDLKNAIAELENQLTMDAKPVDNSELLMGKGTIEENIREIYKRQAKREQIERAKRELEDLEEKRIQNNQALADVEKLEFTAMEFQKDKDARLLEKINGMFQLASFSFVKNQLNGGENLTCVCTVNGTPYPDVNNAGKVNAGIDIINALCRAKGITAPIFIDNRESVNEIIPTLAQVINLVVSNDKQLTIK